MSEITVAQAKAKFLESAARPRSISTIKAYSNALDAFSNMLASQEVDVASIPVADLREDYLVDFVLFTKNLSPATESLYLQVIKSFFEFLDAEHLTTINTSRVRMLIRKRSRRPREQTSGYPEDDIKRVIGCIQEIATSSTPDSIQPDIIRMRDKRDSALILTLADTGLRVEEICKLKISDIDWTHSMAILTGRGRKQSFVRFSTRAIHALKAYLDLRAAIDMKAGQDISTLPLFARYDKGAGRKIKPVTSTTIRNIVADRVNQILGAEAVGTITPHTFLHYFVTTILRSTGNLKIAQELARHTSIQITQKYAHVSDDELDQAYAEIFEQNK
jgi:integrase/recombinase XerC/integrase/recombinase XerD